MLLPAALNWKSGKNTEVAVTAVEESICLMNWQISIHEMTGLGKVAGEDIFTSYGNILKLIVFMKLAWYFYNSKKSQKNRVENDLEKCII